MRKFEERRQHRRYLYSIPALILMLVFIFVLGRATWQSFLGANFAKDNAAAVKSEKTELEDRGGALGGDLAKLESERGMEEIIRDKFAVGKEGEEVIILVDNKADSVLSAENEESFWQKVLSLFK
jgi:ABC-type sugar transport system permease subunit